MGLALEEKAQARPRFVGESYFIADSPRRTREGLPMAHVPGNMSHPPQHALRVQRAGPETPFDPAGLFVLDPLVPAALGGQWLLHLADQWQASFIQAGNWRLGVVGVSGAGQSIFQAGPAAESG